MLLLGSCEIERAGTKFAGTVSPGSLDEGLFPFGGRLAELEKRGVRYVDGGRGPPLLPLRGLHTRSFFLDREIIKGKR
jgi:hypothetical protein